MDLIISISLWMRADTDWHKNGDAYDFGFVIFFSIVSLAYPIFSLVFLYKNHDKFYAAYIRDKSRYEQALGEIINNKFPSKISKHEVIDDCRVGDALIVRFDRLKANSEVEKEKHDK